MDLWVRQLDWYSSEPDHEFVNPDDIDNCYIEQIIANSFRDPLISSDSSNDEENAPKVDWDKIFAGQRRAKGEYRGRTYVAGLQFIPKHPKLSALDQKQQYTCLKVLCSKNINVLSSLYMPRTTKQDLETYEELKETYLKEQKEYLEWAKTLWTTDHCARALRPEKLIEKVYDAEFSMKAHELDCFPKNYKMAAHISLYNANNNCDIFLRKELINVNVADIKKIEVPILNRKVEVYQSCPMPEPCKMHPCKFILPNEKSMTVLPLSEIHQELAKYATDNGAGYIASESALKCLVETDRYWSLPVSVCQTMNTEGEKLNVLVIGSEFSLTRKPGMTRTYRACRHLIEHAFSAKSATDKSHSDKTHTSKEQNKKAHTSKTGTSTEAIESINTNLNNVDIIDSDDEGLLVINEVSSPKSTPSVMSSPNSNPKYNGPKEKQTKDLFVFGANDKKKNEFYSCNCKQSQYKPPPRSFNKWVLKSTTRNENNSTSIQNFEMIVHCSHKTMTDTGEVIVEPIPEYQLEIGGSKQSLQKIKSLALSLLLRENTSLLNVRLSAITGEVVTIDELSKDEFTQNHGDHIPEVANIISDTLSQLQGLKPGQYILQHEPSHGSNALLYAPTPSFANSEDQLKLNFNSSVLAQADESLSVKTPPDLAPVLLPIHKYRKMLPLAFTPFPDNVAKEPKKPPPSKVKTPPQAIKGGGSGDRGKWPKNKKKKKKPRNNRNTQQNIEE